MYLQQKFFPPDRTSSTSNFCLRNGIMKNYFHITVDVTCGKKIIHGYHEYIIIISQKTFWLALIPMMECC